MPLWVYVGYMLYIFKINFFFCKALLDPVFPVIAMQIFYFKNSSYSIIYCYDFKSVFNLSMILK